MQRHHLYIFCYDISKQRTRARVASRLTEKAVRVQRSVFEARLTPTSATRLATICGAMLDDGDSLRVYVVTKSGMKACQTFGDTPPVTDADYMLL